MLWSYLRGMGLECMPVHVCAQLLGCVLLFLTLWTVACQAPLPMEFLSKNTGIGCHFLLQGTFLTQGSNLHLLRLLHCSQILFH